MEEKVKRYNAGNFDVIVVGAGHAGCEAALASARMGNKTLLLTISLDMIAFMPCNPSIGGPAKGVVVREIDALGGEMGHNIDKTYVQMRMLNTGKGPAVRALRAQADKDAYHRAMKYTLEQEENLTLRQGLVNELIVNNDNCEGVITATGAVYHSKTVVLTTGTSSRGKIIIGELMYSSGPNNSQPSIKLSENLEKLGFSLKRFKTGTPPRVNGKTINYEETEEQPGDRKPHHFSFDNRNEDYLSPEEQLSCWLTYTNEGTHEIIRNNLDRAPMFSGIIEGVGPRYCPSIEDKIVRFADKKRHQLFLEPEGRNNLEWYVQGLSTSMPEEVQKQILHSIKGLENASIMRPGYAIEYDIVEPYQLDNTLETKLVHNLFTAGQINGTSGYEEAAGQGIIAGINAGRKAQGKDPVILQRSDAYIGVMIDDLVTKGTLEPYRLLTSRAEYRLILRHDNADLRLREIGHNIGLISDEKYLDYQKKKQNITREINRLNTTYINPSKKINEWLLSRNEGELKDRISAASLLKRPHVTYQDVLQFIPESENNLSLDVIEQVEIELKYDGYIKKEQESIDKLKRMESKKIPKNINYEQIEGLATEGKQKLSKIRPKTIAQASRISGVTPADISILSIYVEQGKMKK
ncbi:MAG: tRNA uridine-5-carboxymethylaminomethyl(34) synthesis enzyme MnmG [Firmicutes bacterium]|uniref:tRNA uridine 5-carboxymethylaminomethyl modification enzyme MnmG n=1 Tax=Candidatus Gallilactobacillus intestinavium TaxID=2840838 RepID=A0A9D9E8F5_9LACO|nr:tRNA uridine-5-carboxymethylaminomethyl(34) synthesis enzyme MnmG [Candidatus Gallilactobacillus intestinavium]